MAKVVTTKSGDRVKVTVPRMKPGQVYAGAEWYGCMNSFQRAVIARSKVLGGVYLVCRESELNLAYNLRTVFSKLLAGKRVVRFTMPGGGKRHGSKHVIYQFKGRDAAVKKFAELNQTVLDFNQNERERAKKFAAAVRRGDANEALRYAD